MDVVVSARDGSVVVCGTWSPIESVHACAGSVVSGDYISVDITSYSPS